jgi:hypothetical protein
MQFSEATKKAMVEQPSLVIEKYRISEGNRLNAADGARSVVILLLFTFWYSLR